MQDDEATVGQVLRVRLVEQVAALREAERCIRIGDAEGVHEARVACRRLQAALAMFRPAVDVRVSEPLREELGWLAGSSGGARDQNVAQERLTALAARDGEAAGPPAGAAAPCRPVSRRRRPAPERRCRRSAGRQGSPHLLSGLDGFGTIRVGRPAAITTPVRSYAVASARSGSGWPSGPSLVESHPPGQMPDVPLHDVRKAAKRLRYGLEVAEAVCGFGSRSDFADRPTSSPTSSVNATTSPSPGRSCSSWRRRLRPRASRPSSTAASTGSRSHGPWSWRHSSSGVWAETVACRSHWP